MRNYFKIEEFLIDPSMRGEESCVPLHVVEKILEHHLPILNPIRHELGMPLFISQHSGYRPHRWEHKHGRDGTSQHTFIGLGAVDLICGDLDKLRKLLIESDYTRVAEYEHDGFFHCDFDGVEKLFYAVTENGIWKRKPNVR